MRILFLIPARSLLELRQQVDEQGEMAVLLAVFLYAKYGNSLFA
jgi:hypothetical protein